MKIPFKRTSSLAASAALLTILCVHCYVSQAEGDRCNIGLSHDECSGAPTIQCIVPTNCVDAFCCGPNSAEANCQACALDAGPAVTDAGGDDGGSDAASAGDADAGPG